MPAAEAEFDDYLYGRISEDDLETEKGVARQLRNCRTRSAASGGRIAGEFSDNNISALKGAHRPGFEQLMVAVTAPNKERRQRRILCQHTSRLWRNRGERSHGIDSLGKAKVIVVPIDGPTLDLRSASGRMIAGMLGEVDTGESETKSERIVDAARERAQEGRANGEVAYGWERVYQYDRRGKVVGFDDVVHPTESAIVQEIVRRVLSGESLISITTSLNDRGIPAPRAGRRRKQRALTQDEDGTKWGKTSVKKIAIRPGNIGMRIYHRGLDDEEILPAAWPNLIDFADHNRVVAILNDPARNIEKPGSRQHLLTWGVGACGICNGNLRTARRGNAQWGAKQILYVCAEHGCVGRNEASVDEYVTEVMVRLLGRPDASRMLTGDDRVEAEAEVQRREFKARLERAAGDYADGLIEASQLRVITSRLKPLIEAAEEQIATARVNPFAELAASAVGDHARVRWAAFHLLQRRAVLQAFGVKVYIDRVARRGPGFDPSSVRIVPRDLGES